MSRSLTESLIKEGMIALQELQVAGGGAAGSRTGGPVGRLPGGFGSRLGARVVPGLTARGQRTPSSADGSRFNSQTGRFDISGPVGKLPGGLGKKMDLSFRGMGDRASKSLKSSPRRTKARGLRKAPMVGLDYRF